MALLNQMIAGVENNRADLGGFADELLVRFVPIRDELQAALLNRIEMAGLAPQATQKLQTTINAITGNYHLLMALLTKSFRTTI